MEHHFIKLVRDYPSTLYTRVREMSAWKYAKYENFNNLTRERVPKSDYVALDCLKFGLYDAVGHFAIGL